MGHIIFNSLLNETIDIDPQFYRAVDKNIKRLQHIVAANLIINQHRKADLLQDYKQEVEGQINFIGMIEGYDSPEFRKYRRRIKMALEPKEDTLSVRWTNTNYF